MFAALETIIRPIILPSFMVFTRTTSHTFMIEANVNISPPTDVGPGMHHFHGLIAHCLSHRDCQTHCGVCEYECVWECMSVSVCVHTCERECVYTYAKYLYIPVCEREMERKKDSKMCARKYCCHLITSRQGHCPQFVQHSVIDLTTVQCKLPRALN
jgi:hypothetical protein